MFCVKGEGLEKLHPFRVTSLYSGGTFDKSYNKRYQPTKFPIPSSTKKVPEGLQISRYSRYMSVEHLTSRVVGFRWSFMLLSRGTAATRTAVGNSASPPTIS
ncbi:hypothetical protein ATANTOWER_008686 [Ataeniobius toweri]|uniref:Uncharacterized protein n=1 Tax=Ataeniobius toweri TaxID=208326 RepID=A0ABU7ABX0_9TELE|nr:hypothetical protein [Ataeniobius toweri]